MINKTEISQNTPTKPSLHKPNITLALVDNSAINQLNLINPRPHHTSSASYANQQCKNNYNLADPIANTDVSTSSKLNIATDPKLPIIENSFDRAFNIPIKSIYIDLPVHAQNAMSSFFGTPKMINTRVAHYPHRTRSLHFHHPLNFTLNMNPPFLNPLIQVFLVIMGDTTLYASPTPPLNHIPHSCVEISMIMHYPSMSK